MISFECQVKIVLKIKYQIVISNEVRGEIFFTWYSDVSIIYKYIVIHIYTAIIWVFPAGRAIRSYCTGLKHGPVSATIPNTEKVSIHNKILFPIKIIHLRLLNK